MLIKQTSNPCQDTAALKTRPTHRNTIPLQVRLPGFVPRSRLTGLTPAQGPRSPTHPSHAATGAATATFWMPHSRCCCLMVTVFCSELGRLHTTAVTDALGVTRSWADASQHVLLAQGSLELNSCTEAHGDGEERGDEGCRCWLAPVSPLCCCHRHLTYIPPKISSSELSNS